MVLRANYNNHSDVKDKRYLMLLLDFNCITIVEAKQIVNKVETFVEENLHCNNCYYTSFDSRGKMKFIPKMKFNDVVIYESNYSISGLILPDKKLRKRIMDEQYFFPELSLNSEKELLSYLNTDDYLCCTHKIVDDFEISFIRKSWEDEFSFECVIRINCFSINSNYDPIINYYESLIKFFSKKFNLFAAYVDYDGFVDGSNLIYEYCYDFQESTHKFKELRTFPWCAYLSNNYLKNHPTFLKKVEQNLYCESIDGGLLFYSNCKVENFTIVKRKTTFNVLKEFLPKSYGVIPVEHLICSGFKPCDNIAYLFEESGNKYVVFSNGVELEKIKIDLQKQYFKYLKTISIRKTGRKTGDGSLS